MRVLFCSHLYHVHVTSFKGAVVDERGVPVQLVFELMKESLRNYIERIVGEEFYNGRREITGVRREYLSSKHSEP